jgi:hypothetical protein
MGDVAGGSVRAPGDEGDFRPDQLFLPLADELTAIAERLRNAAPALGEDWAGGEHVAPVQARSPKNQLALARKAYALRRKRTAIFGNAELFGEPAWDILVDLFIAQAEGKSVSVSSACIGSAAPATTGLRWLGVLADEGLVVRENDAEDQRRVLVRLTARGLSAMERYFNEVESAA